MHTPTQAGVRRSTEVRGGSLRRWLLALGVIAGLLLSHVLNDHDVAPDHDSTVAGPVMTGWQEPFDASVLPVAGSAGGVPDGDFVGVAGQADGHGEVLPVPIPAALDLLAGCVLALLVIAGAVAVMALTGRRSVAASSPGPVHSDVGSPDGGARTRVALCVLRV